MKILHTVEFYPPSVGGAQEVVRQISERLVQRGHDVTVATTFHPDRSEKIINGVKIEEFSISGNSVQGFHGETERYQRFLVDGDFDVMMNYAAQQSMLVSMALLTSPSFLTGLPKLSLAGLIAHSGNVMAFP